MQRLVIFKTKQYIVYPKYLSGPMFLVVQYIVKQSSLAIGNERSCYVPSSIYVPKCYVVFRCPSVMYLVDQFQQYIVLLFQLSLLFRCFYVLVLCMCLRVMFLQQYSIFRRAYICSVIFKCAYVLSSIVYNQVQFFGDRQ